jgi:hypothetical protein
VQSSAGWGSLQSFLVSGKGISGDDYAITGQEAIQELFARNNNCTKGKGMIKTRVEISFKEKDSDNPAIRIDEFLAFFENCGNLYTSIGEAEGEDRAVEAVKVAIDSFNNRSMLAEKTDELLKSLNIQGPDREEIILKEAGRVLVNISGDESITIKEINGIMHLVSDNVSKQCDVFFGQSLNQSLGCKIRVVLIATEKSRIKKSS